MSKSQLFAAVWSDYPNDGKNTGYCDEWVDVYPTYDEAVKACEKWLIEERGANVKIFVAEGLNLDGEYGEELVSW